MGLLALPWVFLLFAVVGFCRNTTFLTPGGSPLGSFGDNEVFVIGESIAVHWESPFRYLDLWLSTAYPETALGGHWLIHSGIATEKFSWVPTLDDYPPEVKPGEDAVCYFTVYETGTAMTPNGTSHYFNLTMSAATPTSQPTSVQTSNTTTDATAKPPPAIYRPKSKHGLSNAAVAGIAVGAMALAAVITSGLALFFWRRAQRLKAQSAPEFEGEEDGMPKEEDSDSGDSTVVSELSGRGGIRSELQGVNEFPAELSSDAEICNELEAGSTMRFPPPPVAPVPVGKDSLTCSRHDGTNRNTNTQRRWWDRIPWRLPKPLGSG